MKDYRMEDLMELQNSYQKRIYQLLDSEDLPLFLREHYVESPNWYGNSSCKNMVQSLIWLSYTKKEKEELLNRELDQYFET